MAPAAACQRGTVAMLLVARASAARTTRRPTVAKIIPFPSRQPLPITAWAALCADCPLEATCQLIEHCDRLRGSSRGARPRAAVAERAPRERPDSRVLLPTRAPDRSTAATQDQDLAANQR